MREVQREEALYQDSLVYYLGCHGVKGNTVVIFDQDFAHTPNMVE